MSIRFTDPELLKYAHSEVSVGNQEMSAINPFFG